MHKTVVFACNFNRLDFGDRDYLRAALMTS